MNKADIKKIAELVSSIKTASQEELLELALVWEKVQRIKELETPKAKKRGRPKGTVKKTVKAVIVEEEDEGDDDEELVQERSVAQTHPRKKVSTGKKNNRKGKGSPGYVEPFHKIKNRPNLFIERGFSTLHKEDSKIDKKLSGRNKPVERGVRNSSVEVECRDCGTTYEVREDLVFVDDDGSRWVCDKCLRKG